MKKIVATLTLLIMMFFSVITIPEISYAETIPTDIDTSTGKLVELKENQKNELADYQEAYGSASYGLVAFILAKVRLYSIPFGFVGIAIAAIYQYIIGIRKMDTRDKGFSLMIAFVTLVIICQVLPLIFAVVVKGWR